MFNMRELSKVFQGMVFANRDRFNTASASSEDLKPSGGKVTDSLGYLLALWCHECQRVFSDKLVDQSEKDFVSECLKTLLEKNFKEAVGQLEEDVYFVDFLREPVIDDETGDVIDEFASNYESIKGGIAEIRDRGYALQTKKNDSTKGSKVDLVLFEDALLHLMRVARVLATDMVILFNAPSRPRTRSVRSLTWSAVFGC